MDKIVVMLRIFFLMLCLLPVAMADNSSNLSGSPVKKSANNQLVDLPSSDIIFYELFKQKPNDDVVILQDKSEARFWFGHVFSVENISYYVGFVAIQEFDRESNDLKMGVMDQARIAQVTFMNDQGKWKVISKNAFWSKVIFGFWKGRFLPFLSTSGNFVTSCLGSFSLYLGTKRLT